jgi:WD40 repeat protein
MRRAAWNITIDAHTDGVYSMVFSPDGKRLVVLTVHGGLKVWDVQTGQETLSLRAHRELGGSLAFSPDGHRLGCVSAYGTVTIWDATPLPEKP